MHPPEWTIGVDTRRARHALDRVATLPAELSPGAAPDN